MTTITEICNLALARLGARRLVDYDTDETTEGKACRLQYEQVRDGLLRRHQWDFAKTSALLDEAVDAPISEWAVAWEMPADCVRIIRISSGVATMPVNRFERRGRLVLTEGMETCELVYVTNAVDIADYDPLFIEALSLKLACRIAGDVTQNTALAAECNNEFEALALPTAQTADARETASGENFGIADLVRSSALVGLRRSRGANDYSRIQPAE